MTGRPAKLLLQRVQEGAGSLLEFENLSGRSGDEFRSKTVVRGTKQRMGWQKRPRALRVRPKCVAPTTSYY